MSDTNHELQAGAPAHLHSEMLKKEMGLNGQVTSTVQGKMPVSRSSSFGINSNLPASRDEYTNLEIPKSESTLPLSTMESIKEWSWSTLKTTRQYLSEQFGRATTKTVDPELEASIAELRDLQQKYFTILKQAQEMATHFRKALETQKLLGESFFQLPRKSPELVQFVNNCETQQTLFKNGEILMNALDFFVSSINTLCNGTIQDALNTARQYDAARFYYVIYKSDCEELESAPQSHVTDAKLQERRKRLEEFKPKFERLRSDIQVKLKFIEESPVHEQLLLFHNAISAYFSGNSAMLEGLLKQFKIQLKRPDPAAAEEPPSGEL